MLLRSLVLRPAASALFLLTASWGVAQSGTVRPCSANDPHHLEAIHRGDPQRMAAMQAADAALEQFTGTFAEEERGGGGEIVIPVVFHIIHLNGVENISDEQVYDAIRVLNEDFNRENSDWQAVNPAFLGLVADVGVSFRLATLDPSGNCTKGITRTVSALTNVGDGEMKDLIQWPRDRYLNIWTCIYADGAAGYTLYPGAVDGFFGASSDGIVARHDYVGAIGTSNPGRSRTLTHEVGHWINLRHVWGDSNEPGVASNCNIDDGVSDTPNSIGWTTCNVNGESCNAGLNNVENYMEYSYCSKMFTPGQRTRMLAALNSSTASRNNLWTVSNRQLTGTWDEPVVCSAEFVSDVRSICAGGSVQFEDRSYHNITSWSWTFEGGSPASSSEQFPVVTYEQPGVYSVGLSVGDGENTVATSDAGYITVLADPGAALPFSDGFETTMVLPSTQWSTWDANNDGTFEPRTDASYSGDRSLRLRNHGAPEGAVDELISTSIDLSTLSTPPVFSFRYAYRQRNSSTNDELRVLISKDCGLTWVVRAILNGSTSLSTAPIGNAPFVPADAGQWGYREITNIPDNYLEGDVRFKFRFISDGGNNLWLDDVNLNGVGVGFEELGSMDGGLLVMPNPVNTTGEVVVDLPPAGDVQLDVLDALGRTVSVLHTGALSSGRSQWALPQDLVDGAYLVRLRHAGGTVVKRFIKQ
ncbi:MAG TPA: M43 family zinc metalloprotease [Flavobacteriales bacterium]